MQKYDVAAYIWPSYTGDEPRSRMFWPEGIGEWQSVKNSAPKANGYNWGRKPLWGYVNEADPYVMEGQIAAADAHAGSIVLMGVDHKAHMGAVTVGSGMNALFTGGFDVALVGAVCDAYPHQILRLQGVVASTAGSNNKVCVGDTGTDVAPGTRHQSVFHQTVSCLYDQRSRLFFGVHHCAASKGPQLAKTRSKRARTSSIISSV